MLTYLKHMALAAAAALCAAPAAQAADQPQEWELINPTGEIEKVVVEPAKRITALEGNHRQGLSGPAGRPRLHAGNGGHAVQVLLAGNLRSGQGLRSL